MTSIVPRTQCNPVPETLNADVDQGVPYLTADDYDAACMRLESEAAEGHKTQEKDGSQRRRVSLSREVEFRV